VGVADRYDIMDRSAADGAAFSFDRPSSIPVVITAIHAGHDLRPEVVSRIAIDAETRRREEDPFTDRITAAGGTPVVVHRSRFEVDLNRPRDGAVYTSPDAAWGLELWSEPLDDAAVERSLAIYDGFYARMADHLDGLAAAGPFAVLDVHSYNHRRGGPAADPEPVEDNPEVNVGTGSLDRERWGPLVDDFVAELGRQEVGRQDVGSRRLDVRENVRFQGGHLSRWVHERYDGVGCALALEFKKVFMDEWSGERDDVHLGQLTAALAATLPGLLERLR
jgi:N-formylglutamate deformylase